MIRVFNKLERERERKKENDKKKTEVKKKKRLKKPINICVARAFT
jgi:hypothetical protein